MRYMKNRYNELKYLYRDYIIVFKCKNKYKIRYIDKEICDYLNMRKLKYLKKYNINYLIINNLDIEVINEYENNRYSEFYLKVKLTDTIKYIKERICVR